MRGSKRIKKVLGAIERIWKTCPDLRLMQLLSNVCGGLNEAQTFYKEDDSLLEDIEDYEKRHGGKG